MDEELIDLLKKTATEDKLNEINLQDLKLIYEKAIEYQKERPNDEKLASTIKKFDEEIMRRFYNSGDDEKWISKQQISKVAEGPIKKTGQAYHQKNPSTTNSAHTHQKDYTKKNAEGPIQKTGQANHKQNPSIKNYAHTYRKDYKEDDEKLVAGVIVISFIVIYALGIINLAKLIIGISIAVIMTFIWWRTIVVIFNKVEEIIGVDFDKHPIMAFITVYLIMFFLTKIIYDTFSK